MLRWHTKVTVKIRRRLTRIHLWIGEALGLTHYRNCHDCIHRADCSDVNLVLCDLYLKEEGALAFTDPCEAVWCDFFEERCVSNG